MSTQSWAAASVPVRNDEQQVLEPHPLQKPSGKVNARDPSPKTNPPPDNKFYHLHIITVPGTVLGGGGLC